MSREFEIGSVRLHEALSSGEDIGVVLTNLASHRSCLPHFAGAVSVLIGCYQKAKEAGLIAPLFNTEMAAFMNMSNSAMAIALTQSMNCTDTGVITKQLTELTGAIHWMRFKGFTWTPSVKQQPEPLKVSIMSFPARITDTKVVRDSELEIVSTVQVEQDVCLT